MEKYFYVLEKWKKPEDVIDFVRTFTFSTEALASIRKYGRPFLLDLEEITCKKSCSCAGVAYYIVKSLNFMNTKFCSFSLLYRWGTVMDKDGIVHDEVVGVGSTNIPVWFESTGIYCSDFNYLDISSLRKIGPFESFEKIDKFFSRLSKSILKKVNKENYFKRGISIIDVRVANDEKFKKAIEFFGVDNQESWYEKYYNKIGKCDWK